MRSMSGPRQILVGAVCLLCCARGFADVIVDLHNDDPKLGGQRSHFGVMCDLLLQTREGITRSGQWIRVDCGEGAIDVIYGPIRHTGKSLFGSDWDWSRAQVQPIYAAPGENLRMSIHCTQQHGCITSTAVKP